MRVALNPILSFALGASTRAGVASSGRGFQVKSNNCKKDYNNSVAYMLPLLAYKI